MFTLMQSLIHTIKLWSHPLNGLISIAECASIDQEPNALATRPISSFDLVDIVLVSFLDGRLVAYNRLNGRAIWSIQLEPDLEGPSQQKLMQNGGFLVEPVKSGRLFHFNPKTGIQPLNLNINELISHAPFSVANSIVYTGSVNAHLYAIDVLTGKVVTTYGLNMKDMASQPLDPSKTLFIGRTEYHIEIHAGNEPCNNLDVRTWTPNNRDQDLIYQYLRADFDHKDEINVRMLSNDTLVGLNHENEILWASKTSTVITGCFDVLRAQFDNSLSVVPQPSFSIIDQRELYVALTPDMTPAVISGERVQSLMQTEPLARFCLGGGGLGGMHPLWCQSSLQESNVPAIDTKEFPLLDPPEIANQGSGAGVGLISSWWKTTGISLVLLLLVTLVTFYSPFIQGKLGTNNSGGKRKRGSRGKKRRTDFPFTLSDEILGYGSHGTTVIKGKFEGRDVAIKRMLVDFQTLASQEVNMLRESDDHPNVVRYYLQHQTKQFLYIVLELCPGTLEDWLKGNLKLNSQLSCETCLYQICLGLQHLHSLNVVHRDIKPQNILVTEKNKEITLLISDFGLCKKLENEQFKLSTMRLSATQGTQGWTAPEIIDKPLNNKLTQAVDIFSLGCLFYHVFTKRHPFGDAPHMQQPNIQAHVAPNLDGISVEAKDIIAKMLDFNPEARPTIQTVINHPVFWSSAKRLDFLVSYSDKLEHENKLDSPIIQELESHALEVIGTDWYEAFPPQFIANLGKYRRYHGDRIVDLLRALRNKLHHYNDFDDELKRIVPNDADGYLNFYTKRFPKLLMTLYTLSLPEEMK